VPLVVGFIFLSADDDNVEYYFLQQTSSERPLAVNIIIIKYAYSTQRLSPKGFRKSKTRSPFIRIVHAVYYLPVNYDTVQSNNKL